MFWVSWLQLFLFLTKVENVAEIPNTLIGYLLKKAIFALLKNKDEGRIKL
jgi:hypothetical protein